MIMHSCVLRREPDGKHERMITDGAELLGCVTATGQALTIFRVTLAATSGCSRTLTV